MSDERGFDERAAGWDTNPEHRDRAVAVARGLIDAVPLSETMRMLEYGAGTGLVTQAVRERVGPVTLADTSQGMRDVIQAKIDSGQLFDARIWDLNLDTDPAPNEQFDLIVTVMTLHQVADVDHVLAGFAQMLAPGGWLCIADLDREDGSFHGHGADVHRGFERQALADALAAAGLIGIRIGDCWSMQRDSRDYPVFLASAAKPAETGDAQPAPR